MVIPDRDIPGIIANACPKPTTMEEINECLEFLFLITHGNSKTRPVKIRAKPTLFTLSNKTSILFLSKIPATTAGKVATKIYINIFFVDFSVIVINIFIISWEKTKITLQRVPI